jgi:hypothetical protein
VDSVSGAGQRIEEEQPQAVIAAVGRLAEAVAVAVAASRMEARAP